MILLVKDNCFTPVKDDWNIMTFMYIPVGVLVEDFKVPYWVSFPRSQQIWDFNLSFQSWVADLAGR